MQKKLLTIAVVALVLIGGVVLAWEKMTSQNVTQNPVEIFNNEDTSVSSDWKTYKSEKYGFELKYPKEWMVEERVSAEIGIVVDCNQQPLPNECRYFSVRIFSSTGSYAGNIVVKLRENVESDTLAMQSRGNSADITSDLISPKQWNKKIGTQSIVKTSAYFPIYGSCYVTARNPGQILNNYDVFFETLYEVSGDLYIDELDRYCSQEIGDPVFDSIVASFSVF